MIAADVDNGVRLRWVDHEGTPREGIFQPPPLPVPPHYLVGGHRYFVQDSGAWWWVGARALVELVAADG